MSAPREIRAPHGTTLTARGWQTEAPLRMLQNNLDPEVAEHPEQLVVYGGTGKAARDWPSFDAIVRTLTDLQLDETLLVQSGRPVGVMRTHEWAPRVLIANSNLVGDWANWEEFRRLEHLGLTMYGQMTAGSWIYIGTQGILQGTYETFAAVAAKRFNGTLAGTITLTAGLGGMGGAQPLAVTMNDGVAICIECDPVAHPAPARPRLSRRRGIVAGRGAATGRRGPRRATPALDRAARQCRVARPAAAGQRRPDRHRHRSDVRARSALLPADRRRVRRLARLRHPQARGVHRTRPGVHGASRRGDGGLPGSRRRGVRLRQLDPRRGATGRVLPGVRVPGLRARLHPAAVLRRARAVSLGGALRRSGATSPVPTRQFSTCSRRTSRWPGGSGWRRSASTSRACPRASAGWATASVIARGWSSTSSSRPARSARRSSSAATTSTPDRSPRPTARPRRCSTARTRSPTGRC